jgi:hypothetical protein
LLKIGDGDLIKVVVPGLDPGIHQDEDVLQERWIAGSEDKFT